MTRKLCVVTTSRSDYGLLYWLMKEIEGDPALDLQILATGMHLATEFGYTVKEIEQDGFRVDKKIDMLLSSNDEKGVVKSIGVGLISVAEVLRELSPEILVVLGDRYELLSVALSALIMRIPMAHIHGGETSQGAIDEAIRHSLTKIASIHFPATEAYRKRIIQMGENPDFVFNFGAPGLDHLYKMELLNRKELKQKLSFDLKRPTAIVTYHPVTLGKESAGGQIGNVIEAIRATGIRAIFTRSNADPQGNLITKKIQEFCESESSGYKFIGNLGTERYLSCLKNLDLMIGNSSSGLVEAPSFKMPVVNIGERQRGRTKAENVIDVDYSSEEISSGIKLALSQEFKDRIRNMRNPYDRFGDGKVSWRIKEKLKEIQLDERLVMKKFRDLPFDLRRSYE